MKKWLRRIRGAVGMGLTWAIGWAPIGAILGLVGLGGTADGTFGVLVISAFFYAASGFFSGVIFSALLGITQRRPRFDEMSLPVFAGIGGTVGGLLATMLSLSTAGPVTLTLAGVLGTGTIFLLGAGSAAGSLALARRADDRELLEAGDDVADIGLTENEVRELLAP
jgi:hypothetical protein